MTGAHKVHRVQRGHKVQLDLLEQLACQDHKDPRESKVRKETSEPQALRVLREIPDHQEALALMVQLDRRGTQEHQVRQET